MTRNWSVYVACVVEDGTISTALSHLNDCKTTMGIDSRRQAMTPSSPPSHATRCHGNRVFLYTLTAMVVVGGDTSFHCTYLKLVWYTLEGGPIISF